MTSISDQPLPLPIPPQAVERKILWFRGQKVMLDRDLADLYEVPTKQLNLAVRRNTERFPSDFMFQLTAEEADTLSIQEDSTKSNRGGRRYHPYVFTEQGVAMLSSVLKSPRAIQVNIVIMRAFVRLRELMQSHQDLARKIEDLERKYDQQFRVVFDAIKQLLEPQFDSPRRKIGFHS